MIFKNSLKLLVANFSVFWKLLLYKLVAIALCALLLIPAFNAWGEAFGSVGFADVIVDFSTKTVFVNVSSIIKSLFVVVETFLDALVELYSINAFMLFYSAFIVLIILPFLFGLSAIPCGEGLYAYMASLTKSSFMANFVSKLGKSCVYSIIRTLILLPFLAVFLTGAYYLLSLSTISGIIQVILPIIFVLYIVLLLSLYTTFMSGFMPASVAFNVSPVSAFSKGLKAVSRMFLRVFSSIFVIFFFTTLLTFMMTSFSLIALIPLASVAIIMLEMVMFFESQGNRYYVDLDSIVSPRKLEQCDKFSKVKNII